MLDFQIYSYTVNVCSCAFSVCSLIQLCTVKSRKRPKIRFRWRSGKRRSSANIASWTPNFRGEKVGVDDALLRAKDEVDLSLPT